MIANVVSRASTSSAADRGWSGSSSQPILARVERRGFPARLAQDVAEPVHAGAGEVANDGPDRPVLRLGPQRELLVRSGRIVSTRRWLYWGQRS